MKILKGNEHTEEFRRPMEAKDCVFQDGSYPCGSKKKPDCELCHKVEPPILSDEEIRKIYLDHAISLYGVEGGAQLVSQLKSLDNARAVARRQRDATVKFYRGEA